MGLLGRLMRAVGLDRSESGKGPIMHLPGDIREPRGLCLFSGPMESDVWPALFMASTLQRAFGEIELNVLCPGRDDGLFNMLPWRPKVHCYGNSPEIPPSMSGNGLPDGSLFFYPYSKVIDSDVKMLQSAMRLTRIAPLDSPSDLVNLVVRTGSPYFPEKLEQMCVILGIEYDREWKPTVQRHAERAAEQIMAPVTGRMLPYIVTTPTAQKILERSRAEIPLRTVTLSGQSSEFKDLDRELKTAVVAGASAVVTDSDDIWGDACAFGVPVVGLDREGDFMKWHGVEASRKEEDFVEAWVGLLKRGW